MNANLNKKTNTVDEPLIINIEGAKRRKCLINGDPNKVLYLNVTDMGILQRLQSHYPKLQELSDKVDKMFNQISNMSEDMVTESDLEATKALDECDKEMRECLDYIFDSNVSEVCDDGGTMYDFLPNGQQRYENIVACLIGAFGDVAEEFAKMQAKRESHTNKYTKKKKG